MKIFTATTPTEAHIICELLKSNQVSCEVRGEGIFGLQGEVPFGENSEPYVWLFDNDALPLAQDIIADYQQDPLGEQWQCDKCHERNEAQFGICWQCGATAPSIP